MKSRVKPVNVTIAVPEIDEVSSVCDNCLEMQIVLDDITISEIFTRVLLYETKLK